MKPERKMQNTGIVDTPNPSEVYNADISEVSAFKVIGKIESSFPIDKLAVDGLHLWPLVRSSLLNQVRSGASKSKQELPILTIRNRLGRFLRRISGKKRVLLNKLRSDLEPLLDADILFYSYVSPYQVNENGLNYDKILDPIYELAEESNLCAKFHISGLFPDTGRKQKYPGLEIDREISSIFTHRFVNNAELNKV